MRVLLIYPNIGCPIGVNHGLSMISGVLKAAGHETKLLHINEKLFDVPTPAELVEQVRAYAPGLIGFSLMSQQYAWSIEAAAAIRAACPEVPLVAGGVHCTMVPETLTAEGHFDVIAVGEAELAFAELVDCLERGEDPTHVPNMRFPPASRFNRRLAPIVNLVGPFPDLNDIAPNDYELFDMRRIVRSKNGWMGILTSRGCPYKCTYCFNREVVERYVEDGAAKGPKDYLRHYPVPRIMGEIEHLRREYEVDTLIVDDDLFTLSRPFVREFCATYKEQHAGLPFVINAHVQVFDDEMAFLLADAGCKIVKYGLESGSDRVRKEVLWRSMSNATIQRAFAAAHRYGIHTTAFVMYGLPTETRAEILETLQLCADVGMGRFRWALYFPFPGTAGARMAEELDVIDHEKAAALGNYFDGTCLRFDPDMQLLLAKLGRVCHWWVNAMSDWGCAPYYQPLVDEVESWDEDAWEANKRDLHRRDRELSEELLLKGVRHYSLRYTHVMAVDSDYVLEERVRMAETPFYVPVGYTLDD
jgi:anaerobic magnesium-protoporphyrin IX monomethyl ester cyclase